MAGVESTSRSHSLTRSLDDRVVAGVCGGLGVYLDTDPVWLRLGFVAASLFWGVGLLVYAILWITLPEQPEEDGEPEHPPLATSNPRAVIGILLVTLGLLAILWNLLSHVSVKFMLPVLLVALGLFLLFHRRS